MYYEKKEKKEKERDGKRRFIEVAKKEGWQVHTLNVSAGEFSTTGFPDAFMAISPSRLCSLLYRYKDVISKITLPFEINIVRENYRWIEFKTKTGLLEASQVERFRKFAECNIGVWVVFDETDYLDIFRPPNWWKFCLAGRIK